VTADAAPESLARARGGEYSRTRVLRARCSETAATAPSTLSVLGAGRGERRGVPTTAVNMDKERGEGSLSWSLLVPIATPLQLRASQRARQATTTQLHQAEPAGTAAAPLATSAAPLIATAARPARDASTAQPSPLPTSAAAVTGEP